LPNRLKQIKNLSHLTLISQQAETAMSRKTIYFPHSLLIFAILLAALLVAVALIFVGAVSVAFSDVGFTPFTILLLLVCTFLGSAINIPVLKLKTAVPSSGKST